MDKQKNKPEEEIDINSISEELLALYGYWKVLNEIQQNELIYLHLKDGSRVSGRKVAFDEVSGIVTIIAEFTVPVPSKIQAERTIMEKQLMLWHFHITQLIGVGINIEPKSKGKN